MQNLVLVVNVSSRWLEVQRGEATVQDVVLGDWNLESRNIDPARIACVYASFRKRIVAAFAAASWQPVPGYAEPRVRFQARFRLPHLEGLTSPHIWQRGEMNPVVAIPFAGLLDEELPGDLTSAEGEEHVELAGYVLCVHPGGDATVLAPAGRTVSVRSLPEDSDIVPGIEAGGIAKTSITADLTASGKQPTVLIADILRPDPAESSPRGRARPTKPREEPGYRSQAKAAGNERGAWRAARARTPESSGRTRA
jgi:hypothetical protein